MFGACLDITVSILRHEVFCISFLSVIVQPKVLGGLGIDYLLYASHAGVSGENLADRKGQE